MLTEHLNKKFKGITKWKKSTVQSRTTLFLLHQWDWSVRRISALHRMRSWNWIAEGVNVLGQGGLLAATILLHKNGLADLEIGKGEKA